MNRRPMTACAFAAALAAASPAWTIPVTLVVPTDLDSVWSEVLSGTPLPRGIETRRTAALATAAEDSAGLIILARQGGSARPPETTRKLGWKIVQRVIRAPYVLLGDKRSSVSEAEALSGAVPVAPLESISLPNVALAVDGKYPGDTGYPLEDEVVLGVSSEDESLEQWLAAVPEPSSRRPLWIGAVGDIMPARGVDSVLLRGPAGLRRVFGDTLGELRSCDALLGNLESAATRGGAQAVKSYTFRFDPSALDALKDAGFTYLSVTNNHSFDFGPAGFLDTLGALAARGIGTSGAGENLEAASRAFPEVLRGGELRVLSYGGYPPEAGGFDGERDAAAREGRPGILWLDDRSVGAAVRAFGGESFNIVMVHGGREWETRPTREQTRLYRRLVEAGADLVIGSHPHVLQGMECWKEGLIAYSLGNFLFPGMEGTPGGEDSVILKVGVFAAKIRYVRAVGTRLAGAAVRLDPTGRSLGILMERTRQLARQEVSR